MPQVKGLKELKLPVGNDNNKRGRGFKDQEGENLANRIPGPFSR
jgi:hypothetical protein